MTCRFLIWLILPTLIFTLQVAQTTMMTTRIPCRGSRRDGKFHPISTIYDPVSNRWKTKTVHFSRYIIGQKVQTAPQD